MANHLESLDSTVLEYIESIASDTDSLSSLIDAISPILEDALPSDADIAAVCQALASSLNLQFDSLTTTSEPTRLKEAVHLGDIAARQEEAARMRAKREGGPLYGVGEVNDVVDRSSDIKAIIKPSTSRQDLTSFTQRRRRTLDEIWADVEKRKRWADLRLENVTVTVAGMELLSNATLSLSRGHRYGLVGKNGVGKTTMLRHLSVRDIPIPLCYTIMHVEQEVEGTEASALDAVLEADEERTALLEVEAQGTHDDLLLTRVHERLKDIDADGAKGRAATILAGLGFSPAAQMQSTNSLSGGWRMRVSLAQALYMQPDLLLLDEPTNMLDIPSVMWLEDYLPRLDSVMVIVSHSKDFLNAVATDIQHMHHGRLDSYKGDYDTFQQTMTERAAHMASAEEAREAHRKHVQQFIDRFRFNAKRASLVQSRIKLLSRMPAPLEVLADPHVSFTFNSGEPLKPPIIDVQDVTFAYPSCQPLFKHLNFTLTEDARVALVGSNGTGKSTLLKLLGGELEAGSGYITRNGKMRIATFSQHHVDQLDLDVTALELLKSSFPGKRDEEYRAHLGRYALSGSLALQKISTLSGGQKSRVTMALMGMAPAHLLLMDEPDNHLDIDTVEVLSMALSEFKGAVVMVSHNTRVISLVCNELWVCEGDGIVKPFAGDLDAYRKSCVTMSDASFGLRK